MRASGWKRIFEWEWLNFLLTNRIPRRAATRFVGWFSRIENPLVRTLSIGLWRAFVDDLALHEAKKRHFTSLHDCFTRELLPDARPIDPDPQVFVSPCDALIGAFGKIEGRSMYQAKGMPYSSADLLGDEELVERYRDGIYVTLRLKSSMYHRFHAPAAGRLTEVIYISGDTWNVNPIALRRVQKLFCKNERAVLDLDLRDTPERITLVPVAAILVASIQLHGLDGPLDLRYRGPNRFSCDWSFEKGQELGYFHHGSTIIVFGTRGLRLHPNLVEGARIRMGEPLFVRSAETG